MLFLKALGLNPTGCRKTYSCIKRMSHIVAVGQHNVFLVISSLPEIIFEIYCMLSLRQNICQMCDLQKP